MTNDTPNPRNSAVYWTGCGMSKNRVLHGSTKKQMHTQGQERVNCLKIEKRENWVNYLTEQCKNTSSQQIQKEKTEENKEKNKKGHCWRRNTNRCFAIHNEYYHNLKQTVERNQVKTLSDDTILFSLIKHHEMKYQKIHQAISTCYSKIKKYEQSQVT